MMGDGACTWSKWNNHQWAPAVCLIRVHTFVTPCWGERPRNSHPFDPPCPIRTMRALEVGMGIERTGRMFGIGDRTTTHPALPCG